MKSQNWEGQIEVKLNFTVYSQIICHKLLTIRASDIVFIAWLLTSHRACGSSILHLGYSILSWSATDRGMGCLGVPFFLVLFSMVSNIMAKYLLRGALNLRVTLIAFILLRPGIVGMSTILLVNLSGIMSTWIIVTLLALLLERCIVVYRSILLMLKKRGSSLLIQDCRASFMLTTNSRLLLLVGSGSSSVWG